MPKIDRDKLLSIGVSHGVAREKVAYGQRPDGERTKAVTDELGNTTTHHTDGRVDVLIKAPQVRLTQKEVRDV